MLDLKPFFEMQRVLDERIIEEKGLEGQDLLPEKILALQVELGELANEWRGFKFWSEHREPRTRIWDGMDYAENSQGGISPIFGTERYKNPLLEEYVDCLHFILSIGLEINFNPPERKVPLMELDIVEQFNSMFLKIADFSYSNSLSNYLLILRYFFGLGEMLGFTWEQITNAYREKNATNHLRQSSGY